MDSNIRPFVLCAFITYKSNQVRSCILESILSNCLDGFRDIDINYIFISFKRLIRNRRDRLAAQLRRDDKASCRTGVAGNRRFVARYGVCKAVGLLNGADDICVQQRGIILANVLLQRIPILLCAAVIYGCQSSTIVKSMGFNARHTLWNGYFPQAAATLKNTTSNARHTFRNDYFRQAAATLKSTHSNARHTLWNRYFRQAAAIPKSTLSNARHTFRNRYFRQASATLKSTISNARHTFRNRYFRQAVAKLKSIHSNARHTFRNRHFRQAVASLKSFISNGLYTLWNVYFRQAFATLKSTISNARHTFRNGYFCQTSAIPKSIISNARYRLAAQLGGNVHLAVRAEITNKSRRVIRSLINHIAEQIAFV